MDDVTVPTIDDAGRPATVRLDPGETQGYGSIIRRRPADETQVDDVASMAGAQPFDSAETSVLVGSFNRLPRRAVEVLVAVASIVAVVGALAWAVAGRGGDVAAETDVAAEADSSLDSASTGDPAVPGGAGSDGGRSQFTPRRPGSGTGEPTSTDSTDPTSPTTTEQPDTSPSTETTQPTTTATEPTTTTTEPTTPGTAAPVPISIVSGPTVNTVTSSSFQFNYTTNDVCGTGSFTVAKQSTGEVVGAFTGQDVCYGPVHGGFPQPSHSTFGGFALEPNTTYRVEISVRGTATDGTKPAGSGTAATSFQVTTAP